MGVTTVDGAFVWRLYDTYGFPTDLTRLMAQENGMDIDEKGFEKAQAEAKEISKRRKEGKGGEDLLKLDIHARGLLEQDSSVPKTDDSAKFFLDPIEAEVKAIFSKSGGFTKTTKGLDESEQIGIILDRTNFYAEQGGQEYDMGHITIDGKADFEVQNVQMYKGYIMHTGYLSSGNLNVGDKVIATYEELRRWPIKNNHTGTHILNFALREVLGRGVDQRGSLVAAEKLRFDFSHNVCRYYYIADPSNPVKTLSLRELKISALTISEEMSRYTAKISLSKSQRQSGASERFSKKSIPIQFELYPLALPLMKSSKTSPTPNGRNTVSNSAEERTSQKREISKNSSFSRRNQSQREFDGFSLSPEQMQKKPVVLRMTSTLNFVKSSICVSLLRN